MIEIPENAITQLWEKFVNRSDVYPEQLDGGKYTKHEKSFTIENIKEHMNGNRTYGTYQINPKTNQIKWVCFDFDGENPDGELPKAKALVERLKSRGFHPLLEFSGKKGYHVWIFCEPIDAVWARNWGKKVGDGIEYSELFPKQDTVEGDGYGNLVKIPMGLHRGSGKRSLIFHPETLTPLEPASAMQILAGWQLDEIPRLPLQITPQTEKIPGELAGPKLDISTVFKKEPKFKDVYEGRWEHHKIGKNKKTRSEAEYFVVCTLVHYNYTDEEIRQIMESCRIG